MDVLKHATYMRRGEEDRRRITRSPIYDMMNATTDGSYERPQTGNLVSVSHALINDRYFVDFGSILGCSGSGHVAEACNQTV